MIEFGFDPCAAHPGGCGDEGVWAAWAHTRRQGDEMTAQERAWQDLRADEAMDYVRMHGAADLVVEGTEYHVTDAWTELTYEMQVDVCMPALRLPGPQVLHVALWYGTDYVLIPPSDTVRVLK